MSDKPIGQVGAEKQELTLQASLGDAVLVKFVAVD
jgi:hypothetical protein